ncbi:MAG: YCF48-related protein [Chromatiales bacterium]|jgi:photosystem II stability/assembly factor-like uncharacterized protein|nr:YCF48-related protein [Chromatiales bacterium]MDH4029590.1 YCF48-related protein [Chromatiales bacterium]
MTRPVTRQTSFLAALALAIACALPGVDTRAQSEPQAGGEDFAFIAPLATETLLLDAARVDGRVVVVGDHGIILVSADDGETWVQSRVPTRSMLTGVWFHDAQTGWAVGHDAVILKTTDGGANWRIVNFQPDLLLPLFDVWFSGADKGIAVGPYGFTLATSDGGETWEESPLEAVAFAAEGAPAEEEVVEEDEEEGEFWEEDFEGGGDFHLNKITASDGRLFIAAEAGNIYRSDDAGDNWYSMTTPYGGSFFSALSLDGGDLLAFGLRGNVFRSADGGETWRQVETPVQTTLTEGTQLDDGTVVIVGMSGTILISEDGGDSFRLVQREDRKALTSVIGRKDGGLIVFGEAGLDPMSRDELS